MVAAYLRSQHPNCRLVKAKGQKVAALRRYLRSSAKSDRIDALTLAKMPFIDPERLDELYLPPAETHALLCLTRQQKRRRSKRRKANSFGIQEKEETVIGRIYEAAEAPQPAATKPSPGT
jgi:transposase